MAKRFPETEIKKLKGLLETKKNILITTHHRPDGDAMGSSLALYNYLKAKKKTVSVITPSDYPDFLSWLPGNKSVINYGTSEKIADKLILKADMIFCLDYNSLDRVDKMEEPLRKSKAVKILIDHHLFPEDVFKHSFSYTTASSTSELIFQFIQALGDKKFITKKIAECIYCGIMTDTNSFRFESMKAETHRIIAELIEAGAENFKIHERVYDSSTESRLRLIGYALKDKLSVLNEYNTAYIALSEAELKMFNFRTGDTEGLVNYALSIEGIKMAAFFSEKDGMVKISFRSKGNFSVQELSSKHFSGGGHKNASGGRSETSLDEAISKFLEILPSYKNKLLKD
ncbi:MAG TPA: bifunctional oligoribonuclease/PAP phosphatase NrnA [Bacteroidia bacterium]|nr:bifunctional oligoribonuclease/PAP phosphatase NrnA [Bacteroidia bacterium]HNS13592.1 bifunctional oligoribonuclease/PAP phosphatase NrnA [Bacteroidia bacterium]